MNIRTTIGGIALAAAAGLGIGACGGSGGGSQPADQGQPLTPAARTLTSVQETDNGFGTLTFTNQWSDGTTTTCIIHNFDDGAQTRSWACVAQDTP
jgi:hypothetical protein